MVYSAKDEVAALNSIAKNNEAATVLTKVSK